MIASAPPRREPPKRRANEAGGTRSAAHIAIQEAQNAGLLEGGQTVKLHFEAPLALVEAAKRESGVTKPSELGLLALALLAQADPVAKFLRETRGTLGPDHRLDT